MLEAVADPDDPRLEDFAHLRSPSLRGKLERDRGIFTVEGRLCVAALIRSAYRTRSLLVDRRRLGQLDGLLSSLAAPVYVADPAAVEQVTGFAFHRGVLAVAERPAPLAVDDVTGGARRLLVVEGVNDGENLGALYRNAAAFGVDAVVLDPTTADPLYRRVVRVSLGHVLAVPTARAGREAWPDVLEELVAEGIATIALTPGPDSEPLDDIVAGATARIAILVGSEGHGLTPGAIRAASRRVRIPIAEGVDSLNVATAAAIALNRLS